MRDSSWGQLLLGLGRKYGTLGLLHTECSFFMWLVAHKRCWTADRLARWDLPQPEHCPMCDQAPETINHLLVGYTFARKFWFCFLSQVSLQSFSPQISDSSLYDWWERVSDDRSGELLYGFNSLIILGVWTLKQVCFWWTCPWFTTGAHHGQRGKEDVVDCRGLRNFIPHSTYICGVDRWM